MKKNVSKLGLLVFLGAILLSCEKEKISPETNKFEQQTTQKTIKSEMQQENQKFSTLSN